MKTFNLIIFICVLSICRVNAQTPQESFDKEFDRGEELFSKIYLNAKTESLTYTKGGYAPALTIFLDLYKQDTTNANLAFKLGVCVILVLEVQEHKRFHSSIKL